MNELMDMADSPTLVELRRCQAKIRAQKHELRCVGAAHQRLLYANQDLARSNICFKERAAHWQKAYDRRRRGLVRHLLSEFGLWLYRVVA